MKKNNKNENIDKKVNLARDSQKPVEHKGEFDTRCRLNSWNGPQESGKVEISGRIKIITV